MVEMVDDTLEAAEVALDLVDIDQLDGPEAVRVVKRLTSFERKSAAARNRAAARAAETDAWKRTGHASPADWLAYEMGTGVGQAKEALATQERLKDQPEIKRAHDEGTLSEQQANEVSKAAKANPGAQKKLVKRAKRSSLKSLKKDCDRIKQAADKNPADTHKRVHAERHVRFWKGSDGSMRFGGSMTMARGAAVKARIEAEVDRIFKQARNDGRREEWDAYAADALHDLVTRDGTGPGNTPKWELIALIDLQVLRRGRILSGETCELVGVGPVPVELINDLEGDPFIKAVIKDGKDIRTICHFGRHIPAELRTALLARDHDCSVPHCGAQARLEIDHNNIDYADNGPAAIWNNDRKCTPHHRQKTHEGYRLEGPPGHRKWIGPDGQIISQDE